MSLLPLLIRTTCVSYHFAEMTLLCKMSDDVICSLPQLLPADPLLVGLVGSTQHVRDFCTIYLGTCAFDAQQRLLLPFQSKICLVWLPSNNAKLDLVLQVPITQDHELNPLRMLVQELDKREEMVVTLLQQMEETNSVGTFLKLWHQILQQCKK